VTRLASPISPAVGGVVVVHRRGLTSSDSTTGCLRRQLTQRFNGQREGRASIPAHFGKTQNWALRVFDWDRFAVVTDLEWISRTTKFMAMLMPMEGRVYPDG
jgi:hypothetical protein